MNYKSKVSENNTELQGVLNDIIALPTYAEGLEEGVAKVKREEARTEEHINAELDFESDVLPVSVKSGYYAEDVVKNIDIVPIVEQNYNQGHEDGQQYIKEMEARDERHIVADVDADNALINIDVIPGYYNEEVNMQVDLEPVYEAGYEDGLAAGGGGGGSSDVDEMLYLGEDRHDEYMQWGDETPFYSHLKWLDYEISSLSSAPVVISLGNNHETKYLHVYVWVYTMNPEEERFETVVVPPADEAHGWYGFNSLEIEIPCHDVRIEGIRWSDDGV